jgi:hypothetical protein
MTALPPSPRAAALSVGSIRAWARNQSIRMGRSYNTPLGPRTVDERHSLGFGIGMLTTL